MQKRIPRWVALCLAFAFWLAAGSARADIVTNGGFETGDFTGWTSFGDVGYTGVDTGLQYQGTYAAFFGSSDGTSGIDQVFSTTVGERYLVEFWLQSEADINGVVAPNSFDVSWNGESALLLTNAAEFGYTHYAFGFTATSVSTDLRFTFQNIPAFWDLDNVSVNVPEPGSLALVGLAGLVGGLVRRRRTGAKPA